MKIPFFLFMLISLNSFAAIEDAGKGQNLEFDCIGFDKAIQIKDGSDMDMINRDVKINDPDAPMISVKGVIPKDNIHHPGNITIQIMKINISTDTKVNMDLSSVNISFPSTYEYWKYNNGIPYYYSEYDPAIISFEGTKNSEMTPYTDGAELIMPEGSYLLACKTQIVK